MNLNDLRSILAWPFFPLVRLYLSFADPHPTSVTHRSFFFAPFFLSALRVCLITFLNFASVGVYGWSEAALKCFSIPCALRNPLRYLHGSSLSRSGFEVSPASTTFTCL